MKLAAALSEGAYVLAEAGVDAPMADARALAEHVVAQPLVGGPVDLDEDATRAYFALIGRRAAREPLQHVLGHMAFRFLTLRCRPGVFVVRPETEWLVDPAVERLRELVRAGRRPLAVDWCAGSGAIGLALSSEVAGVDVVAVEIDPAAAELSVANAEDNPPAPGSTWRLVEGDAAARATLAEEDGCVDVIVSNPPYVPHGTITQPEALADPDRALYGGGADGLDIPRALVRRAATLLRPGGLVLMEHGADQGEALVAEATAAGFTARCDRDALARPRWLRAERPGP